MNLVSLKVSIRLGPGSAACGKSGAALLLAGVFATWCLTPVHGTPKHQHFYVFMTCYTFVCGLVFHWFPFLNLHPLNISWYRRFYWSWKEDYIELSSTVSLTITILHLSHLSIYKEMSLLVLFYPLAPAPSHYRVFLWQMLSLFTFDSKGFELIIKFGTFIFKIHFQKEFYLPSKSNYDN